MTPEQQKEELSKAYVHAVAAACGYAVGNWSQDQGCLDMTIGAELADCPGRIVDPTINLQLKATSDARHLSETHVAWQVSRAHYDKLRGKRTSPMLLAVLLLPDDEAEWVSASADALVLRRCMFYLPTADLPPIGTDSKVLHVPRANAFTPDALRTIMLKTSRGEPL